MEMENIKDLKDCDEVVVKTRPSRLHSLATLLRGVFWGGVISGAIVMLSTPRSGPEMRAMLRERSSQMKDKAQTRVDQARSQANDLLQRGNHVVSEQKANLQGAVEGVKEGVRTYQAQGSTDIGSSDQHQPSL